MLWVGHDCVVQVGGQLATRPLHDQIVSCTACSFLHLPSWPHPCMPKVLNRLLQRPSQCKFQLQLLTNSCMVPQCAPASYCNDILGATQETTAQPHAGLSVCLMTLLSSTATSTPQYFS